MGQPPYAPFIARIAGDNLEMLPPQRAIVFKGITLRDVPSVSLLGAIGGEGEITGYTEADFTGVLGVVPPTPSTIAKRGSDGSLLGTHFASDAAAPADGLLQATTDSQTIVGIGTGTARVKAMWWDGSLHVGAHVAESSTAEIVLSAGAASVIADELDTTINGVVGRELRASASYSDSADHALLSVTLPADTLYILNVEIGWKQATGAGALIAQAGAYRDAGGAAVDTGTPTYNNMGILVASVSASGNDVQVTVNSGGTATRWACVVTARVSVAKP